jgi:hypothetical protein
MPLACSFPGLAVQGRLRKPSTRARVAGAVVAALWALVCLWRARELAPGESSDFDHLWFASRALLAGRDPYLLVGPGREFEWPWLLFYPGTALVGLAPLAALPLPLARGAFVMLSAALLCWGISRDGWWRFPLFVSAPFFNAAAAAQWSILLSAAVLILPPVVAAAMKPTVGLAVLASARTQRAQVVGVAAGAVQAVVSLLLLPTWPWRGSQRPEARTTCPLR